MDSVFTALLMIPAGVGFLLAMLGTIPFFQILGGRQMKGAKDVAYVAVPLVVGAIGMMSTMTHLILPES
ncbi:hypothetical protein AWH63_11105 [Marinobacter sp. C18]|uniref:hypothetical protein n=1 Tax=Marinobacter sp. C18 TaxID=1772288 RepID=UPI000948C471|nr:hypothetical protein [Marinobacter sp. C18]OLF82080.1 hypothetical protein AWH63_11105 [Marinobacter sp. C18]